MRRVLPIFIGIALLAPTMTPAHAKVSGPNGLITFGRFDPAIGDQVVYVVDPDGGNLRQVVPGSPSPGECPRWSPDGSRIATCGTPEGGATRIIDPDTGAYHDLAMPDPTLFSACMVWSPDARRLACEAFNDDGSRNGIYTIRTADGRGLRRITSNPGGDDIPGDYSSRGDRIVFGRTDPTRPERANQAIFVVDVDGTGLTRITPWSLDACCGSWSPDGRAILFAGGGWLYTVGPKGTRLMPIRLDTGTASYFATHPGWSPDGTMIVFSLFLPQNGALDIYVADADGTDLVQVSTALPGTAELGEGDELADWGPHPPSG